jgi:G:T-mismatch repair DNA endonuclease (very short patch repair protein)
MRRWMRRTRAKPNGLEQWFMDHCGFTVEYTGNRALWIRFKNRRYKNPDFIIPGTKIVIELFGDYFHTRFVKYTPEQLTEKYAEVGYKCYVFWESEIYAVLSNQ